MQKKKTGEHEGIGMEIPKRRHTKKVMRKKGKEHQ